MAKDFNTYNEKKSEEISLFRKRLERAIGRYCQSNPSIGLSVICAEMGIGPQSTLYRFLTDRPCHLVTFFKIKDWVMRKEKELGIDKEETID